MGMLITDGQTGGPTENRMPTPRLVGGEEIINVSHKALHIELISSAPNRNDRVTARRGEHTQHSVSSARGLP